MTTSGDALRGGFAVEAASISIKIDGFCWGDEVDELLGEMIATWQNCTIHAKL